MMPSLSKINKPHIETISTALMPRIMQLMDEVADEHIEDMELTPYKTMYDDCDAFHMAVWYDVEGFIHVVWDMHDNDEDPDTCEPLFVFNNGTYYECIPETWDGDPK